MRPIVANRQDDSTDLSGECVGTTVGETETIALTVRDWEVFLAAWDDVDRPRPRLEEAARLYRSRRQLDAG
jgi:hypothetical protein